MLLLSLSFLGFKWIVDDDVKDLLEEFQKPKLDSIDNKLDDLPTREELERIVVILSSSNEPVMDELQSVTSLLREVSHKLDSKFKNNDYLQFVKFQLKIML